MHYRYMILFLLLSCVAYAEDDVTVLEPEHGNCTGYNDSFNVQVLDAKSRPIPDAGVTATYDRGATFGSQYFTTPVRRTDSAGLVHFDLINQGTNSREIDCEIVIAASVTGGSNSTTIFALEHGTPVDLSISNVYPVRFYIRDESGTPLPNATVTIAGLIRTADADGLTAFFMAIGNYTYLTSYRDGAQAGHFAISDDATFEVVLRSYRVTLNVTDDFGSPLPATLRIFNKTFQLENGSFEYAKTFGSEIPYRTEYRGLIREGILVPSANPNARVVYDIHAPLFGDIKSGVDNGRYRLTIPLSDPGEVASGVDFPSLRVAYRVEPADAAAPWNPAVTFTSGRSMVTAEFPELPPNAIVSFKADVNDKAGNRASIEGRFSTLAAQTPANNTQNQTNTQPSTGQEQGIPLLYIFAGAIAALLIVYVVFRIKAQGGGGG